MSCCLSLGVVWFFLEVVLFAGYFMLDGFDLGVGSLHLFVKKDKDRRVMLNAIGPVWDGNEVWLVTGVGALFAAFPRVYATLLSGFYFLFMLLLLALIVRAVSIEFRGKLPDSRWRSVWDWGFSLGSLATGFLLGVIFGNVAGGVPLDSSGEFAGTSLSLLNPYALLFGAAVPALFAMHGALYMLMKTDGELHRRMRDWAQKMFFLFAIFFVAVAAATVFGQPHILAPFKRTPVLFVLPLLTVLAAAGIARELRTQRDGRAFLCSCAVIVLAAAFFAVGLFPNMLLSDPRPEYSLTIYNASASPKSLKIILIIAAIGMPLVLVYTAYIYRVFRGTVKLGPTSY